MRELYEGSNAVPDVHSLRDLSADIFSNQITEYTQRPSNKSKPTGDNGNEADEINMALNPSSLYGTQIAAPDRDVDLAISNNKPSSQPPSLEDALLWAKDNMSRLDGNRDGGISNRELTLANFGNRLSPRDQEMAKVLMDNYEMLKLSNIDKFKPSVRQPEGLDAISMKDIDNRLGRIDFNRRLNENAKESKETARRLISGEPPLFEFLDQASNGKVDGKISKGDLEKYMKNARYFAGATSGPYSQENVQTVQRLLDTWDSNTFPSPGAALRGILTPKDFAESHLPGKEGKYKFITYDSLAKAAGLA